MRRVEGHRATRAHTLVRTHLGSGLCAGLWPTWEPAEAPGRPGARGAGPAVLYHSAVNWLRPTTNRALWKKHSFADSRNSTQRCKAAMCACPVVSGSLRPHGLYLTRLLRPWNFPGRNTGAGCRFLPKGSSRPRDLTHGSCISCIGRCLFYHWAVWEAINLKRERAEFRLKFYGEPNKTCSISVEQHSK